MSTQQFSDADRLGCEGCPDNPENREYLQQRGVSVSGVDGRPKSNPVLEAIELAMLQPKGNKWYHKSGREEFCPSYANEALMKVKESYLRNHPQGPEVAGRTTNYYACRNCGEPIDMIGTGSDGLVAPSDGREFDRYIRENWVEAFAELFDDLISAHNADRAADKQRIAELEAQLRLIMSAIPCGNISTHTPENAPGRIRDLVSECSRLEGVIEELISAAQNPRVMKRWGVDGVPAPGVMCWLLVGGIMHKERLSDNEIRQCRIAGCSIPGEISHWLELEPTPNLPTDETSDDMSSLAGDGDA